MCVSEKCYTNKPNWTWFSTHTIQHTNPHCCEMWSCIATAFFSTST